MGGEKMTDREREILNIIKLDPMISQKELGEILTINRASVAVHVANLMKKGYIKGRGYIITEECKATIIGGTNIDLQGFPQSTLNLLDSNPGSIETSLGGVGRNIAENLNKLLVPVRLLTAVGDDFYGHKVLKECKEMGIDMEHTLISKRNPTSMYLSVMDEDYDMKVAISQMNVFDEITHHYIRKHEALLKNSKVIVLDTNIPKDTMDYICTHFNKIPIFVDTVSKTKSMRIKDSLKRVHTIKPNMHEVAQLLEMNVDTLEDVRKAGELLLNLGVKRAFISMGKDGVFACDKDNQLLISSPINSIKSTTGAGDAFMAGIVKSFIKGYNLEQSAIYAMATANIALDSHSTVNPAMLEEGVQKVIESQNFHIKYLTN